ncbi:MAG TPA: glycosyl hydrolase, partial [Alteromonas mediterranea]|nr:glycosyl hydrolase [Alteromonas mediterranea]
SRRRHTISVSAFLLNRSSDLSHDRMANWRFMANLPLTQFYKVAPDDSTPFYKIYAGAQDNSTQGGPSRTMREEGIKNKDWFLTLGGDGHGPATEPGNPDIVYSQWQQGNLTRVDMKTREGVYIKPQPLPGDPAERYNWDAPINVSAHDPARIYFASQRVWRSDDRGDSWTAVSGDLTKNGNRMHSPLMGRTWSVEAGWDLYAMTEFHTIANFAESPVDENILWAGTDDGIIQVTTNGGKSWKKIELDDIRGIPANSYVNDIRADLYDPNTVYVALDNHKYGDYKPYLIKSTNLGKSWTSLAEDLPEKHLVWRIVQDHVNKDLLFIGTEFGVFFSVNGGKKWVELDGGMPTISTRDVKIQRRENDLVAGTFGRGIYILDDYAPLRSLTEKSMQQDAILFGPSRPVKWFQLDDNHTDSDGDDRFVAKNPEHGATFTYYLKDSLLTAKEKRQEADKKAVEDKKYPKYPSWEAVEAENQEAEPAVYIEVRDSEGDIIKRVDGKTKKGLHRLTWDMKYASTNPLTEKDSKNNGLMALPGSYTATLFKRVGTKVTPLSEPVSFELAAIVEGALEGATPQEMEAYGSAVSDAQKRAISATTVLKHLKDTMALLRTAIDRTPSDIAKLEAQFAAIQEEIHAVNRQFYGLKSRDRMGIKPANIMSRLRYARSALGSSYGPTAQHKDQLGYANDSLDSAVARIGTLQSTAVPALQQAVVEAGGPWTSGLPVINK